MFITTKPMDSLNILFPSSDLDLYLNSCLLETEVQIHKDIENLLLEQDEENTEVTNDNRKNYNNEKNDEQNNPFRRLQTTTQRSSTNLSIVSYCQSFSTSSSDWIIDENHFQHQNDVNNLNNNNNDDNNSYRMDELESNAIIFKQQEQSRSIYSRITSFNLTLNEFITKMMYINDDNFFDRVEESNLMFNDYFLLCAYELIKLEKEIDELIKVNNWEQSLKEENRILMKWSLPIMLGPNQMHLFVWNLFDLHEKLMFVNCKRKSVSDEVQENALPSPTAIYMVSIWYQIVEQIKDNLFSSYKQLDDGHSYMVSKDESNESIMIYLKPLWKMTRHLRTLFWLCLVANFDNIKTTNDNHQQEQKHKYQSDDIIDLFSINMKSE